MHPLRPIVPALLVLLALCAEVVADEASPSHAGAGGDGARVAVTHDSSSSESPPTGVSVDKAPAHAPGTDADPSRDALPQDVLPQAEEPPPPEDDPVVDTDISLFALPEASPAARERLWLPIGSTRRMRLDGLYFPTPMEVDTPFVGTSFRFSQGLAILEMPGIRVPESENIIDLQLIGLVSRVELALALHRRFGLQVRAQGHAVAGSNADTAYFVGVRAGARWEAGVLGELWRAPSGRTVLGARARYIGSFHQRVQPAAMVDWVLDQPELTIDDIFAGRVFNRMLSSDGGSSAGFGLSVAHRLHRRVGLLAGSDLRHGTSSLDFFDGSESLRTALRVTRVSTGGALHAALEPLPLILQIEYRYALLLQRSRGRLPVDPSVQHHTIGFNTWLSGRAGNLLGLVNAVTLDRDDRLPQRFWSTQLVFQLFW